MGITGLWPLLEPTCEPVSLEALEGKVLAVDVSIWIYQAQLGYPGDVRCPHVALLVSRLCKLLYYKIKPVFVFDGDSVPSFKRRILNERRLKKHTDNLVLDHATKRTLLDLATGSQTESEIDTVKNKIVSLTSKRQRVENDLFDILPSEPVEVVDLSSDDEDVVVVDTVQGEASVSRTIDILMDERERIRNSRLRPSQLPADSRTFSNFQLQRLLTRSRLTRNIQMLCENRDSVSADPSALCQSNSDGQHTLLSVEDDSEGSSSDDFEEGFYSKTSMIEDHAKRNTRNRSADPTTLRSDDWSSDSGTDDFIDVPSSDSLVEQYLKRSEDCEEKSDCQPSTSTMEERTVTGVAHELSANGGSVEGDGSEWIDRKRFENTVPNGQGSGCYKDLQDFLTACGFPWIEAPGEAEAQCVELERLGLVQGVISDDSDVWAFGVKDVYRHLFSKNKNVQHYESRVIRHSLGLTQADFVGIAVLSGGDYSPGLAGVGVVNAVELLSEFSVTRSGLLPEENQTLSTLKNVGDWLASFASTPTESIALRRKLRSVIVRNNDAETIATIVQPSVVEAYFRPNVDKSREKFRWRKVDVERVRHLLYEKLGWDDERFEKQTLVALQRWNEFITGKASYQRHITSFTHKLLQSPGEQKTALTRRVETALAKLAERTGSSSSLAFQSKPLEKNVRKRNAKSRAVSRKSKRISPKELQLSEESE